jgi:hypothetical protein
VDTRPCLNKQVSLFYPRSEWLTKEYKAELTVTQEVANDSFGGVIYFLSHSLKDVWQN